MNNFSNDEFNFSFLDEGFTAKDILDQKINEVSSSDDKDAFYVADLGDVLKKHLRWYKAFPRVTPFYAVKCNDSRAIVKTLATIGAGFDCASKTEIQLVQSLGVSPERIIYANPCKQVSQIKYAANNGVQMMTFDSEVELMKVARAHPKAKLVLRIATDDSKAVCRLSVKFGATLKTSRLLLERAKELNIDIIGVSFHVGSGCTDPETFVQAVSDARCVFDMGVEFGFNMYLLDIGGGFPGSEDVKLKFEEISSVVNPALDKYFPSDSGVRIIAEPGRYYVASAFTLAVNIIAKKLVLKEQTGSDDEDEANDQTFMYYVNDGVYGSFNCILFDHAHVKPILQKVIHLRNRTSKGLGEGAAYSLCSCFGFFPQRPKPDEKYYSSSIWGPTCDGLDRIVERCDLPEMHVGDWMLFENMGAYTVAAASTFNGFQRPTIYYVMSGPAWQCMQQMKNQGFPAEVEDQDINTLPLSCAWESGMEHHSTTCTSASINV
ncbi:ornithine decarboxylase isoform X1 [Sarcophilus harrisii]|uniref:ornithine decarboxylase isoform X1 n=1 Tax=Sarcophilus harrisii TaxID=9305 RepID=UPI001301C0F7|nr:ornithine decarboxylase isoform X1 [Sarcophilus harrisii]XP_031807158.1 ornithine decarboxylase isoform X1 [Sarcophilus harrisii]